MIQRKRLRIPIFNQVLVMVLILLLIKSNIMFSVKQTKSTLSSKFKISLISKNQTNQCYDEVRLLVKLELGNLRNQVDEVFPIAPESKKERASYTQYSDKWLTDVMAKRENRNEDPKWTGNFIFNKKTSYYYHVGRSAFVNKDGKSSLSYTKDEGESKSIGEIIKEINNEGVEEYQGEKGFGEMGRISATLALMDIEKSKGEDAYTTNPMVKSIVKIPGSWFEFPGLLELGKMAISAVCSIIPYAGGIVSQAINSGLDTLVAAGDLFTGRIDGNQFSKQAASIGINAAAGMGAAVMTMGVTNFGGLNQFASAAINYGINTAMKETGFLTDSLVQSAWDASEGKDFGASFGNRMSSHYGNAGFAMSQVASFASSMATTAVGGHFKDSIAGNIGKEFTNFAIDKSINFAANAIGGTIDSAIAGNMDAGNIFYSAAKDTGLLNLSSYLQIGANLGSTYMRKAAKTDEYEAMFKEKWKERKYSRVEKRKERKEEWSELKYNRMNKIIDRVVNRETKTNGNIDELVSSVSSRLSQRGILMTENDIKRSMIKKMSSNVDDRKIDKIIKNYKGSKSKFEKEIKKFAKYNKKYSKIETKLEELRNQYGEYSGNYTKMVDELMEKGISVSTDFANSKNKYNNNKYLLSKKIQGYKNDPEVKSFIKDEFNKKYGKHGYGIVPEPYEDYNTPSFNDGDYQITPIEAAINGVKSIIYHTRNKKAKVFKYKKGLNTGFIGRFMYFGNTDAVDFNKPPVFEFDMSAMQDSPDVSEGYLGGQEKEIIIPFNESYRNNPNKTKNKTEIININERNFIGLPAGKAFDTFLDVGEWFNTLSGMFAKARDTSDVYFSTGKTDGDKWYSVYAPYPNVDFDSGKFVVDYQFLDEDQLFNYYSDFVIDALF